MVRPLTKETVSAPLENRLALEESFSIPRPQFLLKDEDLGVRIEKGKINFRIRQGLILATHPTLLGNVGPW